MTKREFLEGIANYFLEADTDEEVEFRTFANEEIEKLNKRNATRSSKPTKVQMENEGIKAQILEVLSSQPMVASAIGEMVGISTQKASALCRQLVDSGKVKVQDVKIPKKGKQKAYSIEESEVVE